MGGTLHLLCAGYALCRFIIFFTVLEREIPIGTLPEMKSSILHGRQMLDKILAW
jgi:hypothetical protein